MNSTKAYVDALFSKYEETKELADFKEELLSNLNAKLDSLVKKGMDETEAFAKTTRELGDVSALADEISLKKRQEVFEERYMDVRRYMNSGRVAAYVVFAVTALFGIVTALLAYTASGTDNTPQVSGTNVPLTVMFGVLVVFLTLAAAGFTFLGLTQETSVRYPMGIKRTAWYTLATALITFGVLACLVGYFATGSKEGIVAALGTLIPFVLPAVGILVFMALTEKNRLKPWAQKQYIDERQRGREIFADPVAETRFGLISGTIWIFAIALFLIAGFALGFLYSWIVFILAAGMQCLIMAVMINKKGEQK
jgi:hypothetical protein